MNYWKKEKKGREKVVKNKNHAPRRAVVFA
jgi:hypothetical protein